jgi:2-keto-4-pentenoate hydratase
MKKRVAEGDSIVGYKASAVRGDAARQRPGVPVPSIGTLLRSQLRSDGDTVPIDAKEGIDFVEPEVLVLLKRDLTGPGVSPMDVLAATEAFFPSIEIAPMPPGFRELKWSHNHIIVDMKRTGSVVIGHQGVSPDGIDLRLEGIVGRLDGEVKGSATACTVMGSPLNVVAAIANDLARFEMGLKAGQIIQTGSIIEPMQAKRGVTREALVEFTRIGSVKIRFSQ